MKWGPGCLPPETKVSSGPTQAIFALCTKTAHRRLKKVQN